MRLTRIAGGCNDTITCPTVYETDRGTIAVQGYAVRAGELAPIAVPKGEAVVEILASLLEEAARARRR